MNQVVKSLGNFELDTLSCYLSSRIPFSASIDYRTTEELGDIDDMSQSLLIDSLPDCPKEWIEHTFDGQNQELSTDPTNSAISCYAFERRLQTSPLDG